jgi:hypothetical protein
MMSKKLTRALGRILRLKAPTKTSNRPSTAKSSGPAMTTYRAGNYNTGISEQAVEQKATEDGEAGSLDPLHVGKNSHPHAVDHLVEGHEAAVGVIGYDLRETVQSRDELLNRELEEVNRTEAEALEAIDEHTSALRQLLVQSQKMRAARLPAPGPRSFLRLLLLLLLLFVGDWGLLALGFQIMGLSDRPWIPGVAFTDDLHFAALSAVVALIFLGHIVGGHVRRIEHAFEVRRQAGERNRDNFPKPAIFDYVWTVVTFATAVGGMIALSSIRAEYLTAIGVDANSSAFVGVQFLILTAAIGISFAHANPESAMWRSVEQGLNAATVKRDQAVGNHTTAVGDLNYMVDRRLADIAQAGHHVHADAANVRGQVAAFKRRYILAQLEPAQEQLFREHLNTTGYQDGELLERLTGVMPISEFSKAATEKVMDALASALEEISTLRAQIDQIEINKLDLPEVEELFASRRADLTEIAEDDSTSAAPISTPEGTEQPPTEADVSTAATKLHPVSTATWDDDSVDDADAAQELA